MGRIFHHGINMALIKSFPTPYGPSIKANYHYICEVGWRKDEALAVQLSGHVSREDSIAVRPVALIRINVPLPPQTDMPSLAECYDLLKQRVPADNEPDFRDAMDG